MKQAVKCFPSPRDGWLSPPVTCSTHKLGLLMQKTAAHYDKSGHEGSKSSLPSPQPGEVCAVRETSPPGGGNLARPDMPDSGPAGVSGAGGMDGYPRGSWCYRHWGQGSTSKVAQQAGRLLLPFRRWGPVTNTRLPQKKSDTRVPISYQGGLSHTRTGPITYHDGPYFIPWRTLSHTRAPLSHTRVVFSSE